MSSHRPLRAALFVTTLTALATLLALPAAHLSSPSGQASGATDTRLASLAHPTDAGRVYRWGNPQFKDEFEVRHMSSFWRFNHPRLVRNQNGMLTMNANTHSRTVQATIANHGRRYGRWEARVRANQISGGHTPFRITWELVPVKGYSCGSRNIEVGTYVFGQRRAHMSIRRGAHAFVDSKARDLSAGPFHTYAVEVTKTHVSWFVDAHVVMTERRAAARTGAVYQVRFKLQAVPGHRMNPTRMQMDWVRYHTLARPNRLSIKAPAAHKVVNTAVC